MQIHKTSSNFTNTIFNTQLIRSLKNEKVKSCLCDYSAASLSISKKATVSYYSNKLVLDSDANKVSTDNSIQSKLSDDPNLNSIEKIVQRYGELSKEIDEKYSGDEKVFQMDALDTAFNDIANKKATLIGTSFDSVLDYAHNNLPSKGFNTTPEIFDEKSFIKNAESMIISLKNNYVANLESFDSDTAMDKAITSIDKNSGTSLEDMSYSNIQIMSDAIDKNFSSSGTSLDVMVRWAKAYDEIIKNTSLSETAKKQLTTAKSENIKAYAKLTTYKEETNNYNTSIEKLAKRSKKLSAIIDKLEEELDKTTDMEKKIRLLKRQAGFKEELKDVNKNLKDLGEKNKKLKQNPDSIEDSDRYKDLMSQFIAATSKN